MVFTPSRSSFSAYGRADAADHRYGRRQPMRLPCSSRGFRPERVRSERGCGHWLDSAWRLFDGSRLRLRLVRSVCGRRNGDRGWYSRPLVHGGGSRRLTAVFGLESGFRRDRGSTAAAGIGFDRRCRQTHQLHDLIDRHAARIDRLQLAVACAGCRRSAARPRLSPASCCQRAANCDRPPIMALSR